MSSSRYSGDVAETWRATAKARTRDRYLSAAGHLFAQRGYHAVSIDDLGSAVGVSGPALYRHFDSKEAMLIELLVDASERLMAGYEATIARGGSDLDTLRDLISFHSDFAIKGRDIIRIQDRELANLPADANHRVRQLQRVYLEGWQRIVERLRPELTPADLEVRMHALFGILNSTPYTPDLDRDPDVGSVLMDAALGALFGYRPAA